MASGLCVPHKQAEHMAAPTEGQSINKTLANGEPSTHGAKRPFGAPKSDCSSSPSESNSAKLGKIREIIVGG
jgi:hypothetical protein